MYAKLKIVEDGLLLEILLAIGQTNTLLICCQHSDNEPNGTYNLLGKGWIFGSLGYFVSFCFAIYSGHPGFQKSDIQLYAKLKIVNDGLLH